MTEPSPPGAPVGAPVGDSASARVGAVVGAMVDAMVDDRWIRLPVVPEHVVDVYVGEHRVVSLPPSAFRRRGGGAVVAWPEVLRRFLVGRAHVQVREHVAGTVLLDVEVQLGDATGPVAVVDRQGRPLAVDKFGILSRMFTHTDDATAGQLADQAATLIGDLADFGVEAFLAFGSLLGAVRNGGLIGHDNDVDLAYLSRHPHPGDVAREVAALARFLGERGYQVERVKSGVLHVMVHDEDGDQRHIDVFTAIHDGTRLLLSGFVLAELPRSVVVPLGSVAFEGRDLPAPADPHALLAATYGPSYLVPDPSFTYELPPELTRTSMAWTGHYRNRQRMWQRYFRAQEHKVRSSAFAERVADRLPAGTAVVEVGCGRGGDSLFYGSRGFTTVGLDFAEKTLTRPAASAASRELPVRFRRVSLYDVRMTVATAAQLVAELPSRTVVSRHLLDVLTPEGRENFWLLCRTLLIGEGGGDLHLRFRTSADDGARSEPGFAPLDPDLAEAEATRHGARVLRRRDRPGATALVLTWTGATG